VEGLQNKFCFGSFVSPCNCDVLLLPLKMNLWPMWSFWCAYQRWLCGGLGMCFRNHLTDALVPRTHGFMDGWV
jgi:hypothetical protein